MRLSTYICTTLLFLAMQSFSLDLTAEQKHSDLALDAAPLTAYSLCFDYSTRGEINRQSKDVLTLCVHFSGDDKLLKASGEPLTKRFIFPPSATSHHIILPDDQLLTPNGTRHLRLEFTFSGPGSIHITEPVLKEISLPEDAVRTSRRIWRRQDKHLEPATAFMKQEKKKGFVLYQREPSRVFPESIPQRHEICRHIRKFTVPGEYCNLHFILHFLRKDRIQKIEFTDFSTDDGKHSLPSSLWSHYQVFFRKKPAWSNRLYFIIPENLYPFAPSDMQSGSNCFLWFQCQLPQETPAGFYNGSIRIHRQKRIEEIPVTLRVLPFRLRKPPVDWIMYGGNFYAGGWQNNSREDIQRQHFSEIASLGFTGMIHHGGIYDEKSAEAICRRLDAAGMHGPLVIDFGWQLEAYAYKRLYGKNISDHRKFPYPECQDERVKQEFIRSLTDLREWMQRHFKGSAWYYQGLDEPHIYGGLSQAAWEYPLAKQAGVKTSSTVYPLREFKEFGKWNLDVSVNAQAKFSHQAFTELQSAAAQQGTTLWLLGPGSYSSGTGIPNRYESGFLFYRTGLPGCVAWTYGGGPDVDELEVERMNMYVTYARKEFLKQEPLAENPARRVCWSTLLAEGLREGILDYRYAYTLEECIRESRERNQPTEHAEKLLEQLRGGMIPFWSEVNKNGDMNEPAMECLRWALAQEILNLTEPCK